VADETVESIPRNISRRIENVLGVSLDQFDTLQAVIAELLILHGSFTDPGRWNPLRAMRDGFHRIYLGGKVYEALAPVGATVSDDFDRTDAATLGANWDDRTGRYGIDTNRAVNEADAGDDARYSASALSSDDHYSQATDMDSAGSSSPGLTVRMSSSAATYYMARINGGDHIRLFKRVAGSYTQLREESSITITYPLDFYFEFDGSNWDVQVDTVSESTGTDTSITGETFAGLWSESTGDPVDPVYYGAWEAADLSAGATFPAAPENLTANAVSSSQVDLSWDARTGATGYDVERDGVVIVEGQAGLTYNDTGLAPDTEYGYRVRARA
jgi:hypothetical protein